MYLVAKTKNLKKAHYWNGIDTFCKMYSTGGLKKEKYHLVANFENREICHMCTNIKMKTKL